LTALALAFGFRPLVFRVVLASGLTLLAGTMEVLQHFVPGRHPAVADAIASSLGGLLGLALGGLLFELATQAYKKRRQLGESPGQVQ
jgi:VanZ family protein